MYLSWNKTTITDFSDKNINNLYGEGYVFTRQGKGVMNQTRSVRIDLAQFEPSSENRRVLRKTENILLQKLAIPYAAYHWSIGKMGKDFYETKFGERTFSAQKIKELMTDPKKSNFNMLMVYETSPLAPLLKERAAHDPSPLGRGTEGEGLSPIGYAICLETNELLHYCYPFYNIKYTISNIGMAMMLKAILWAQENNKKHIYLGSFQRPTDTYKLQFAGLQWFDGEKWQTNLEKLKNILKKCYR